MIERLRSGCWFSFLLPDGDSNAPGPPVEDIREAWSIVREELITEAIANQPGARPAAFWQFDATKRPDETEPEALARWGLLLDGERMEVEALLDAPLAYLEGKARVGDDGEIIALRMATERELPIADLSEDGLRDRFLTWHGCQTPAGRRFGTAMRAVVASEIKARGIRWGWWVDQEVDRAADHLVRENVPASVVNHRPRPRRLLGTA